MPLVFHIYFVGGPMRRRVFLKALAGLPLSFAASAAVKAQGTADARRFIDVHCHFFNAADLPVRGFLERVALADYAAGKAEASGSSGIPVGVWRGMVARI